MSAKRAVSFVVAAGLAVVATPAGSAAASASSWLGTTTTATVTTLAQIRSIIAAATGDAAKLTGKGVGVALIDTGVAPVPGLPVSQIVNGPDLSFESQAANLRYLDTYGHGTHMAGIIVGNDTATGTKGLAPDARLTSIKVGTASGAVDVSQVIAAVDWVVKHRADDPANPIKVINLSYGSGGTPYEWNDSLGFAVEKAWQSGIVVVAAAGNDGNAAGRLANPASDEWILSVGAAVTNGTVTAADDSLATFTNLPKGGKQINVLAPGVSVLSLRDNGSSIDTANPSARVGETLFRGSGTSQAAAMVSGSAALLLQQRPSLTPDQVKRLLMSTATKITNGDPYAAGAGQIDIAKAARAKTTPSFSQINGIPTGLGSLERSRGGAYVYDSVTGSALTGEKDIFGRTWSPLTWSLASKTQRSWSGGLYNGSVWTGSAYGTDGYGQRTWTPVTWSGRSWSNVAWSGRSWSGAVWTGRSWSSQTWSGRSWSGRSWSSAGWTGAPWQ
jgi:serine protease AprX